RRQVALDLFARAGAQDVGGPRHYILQGEGGPPELPLHQREADMVEPAAAEILGHVGGIEAGLERLVADLPDQLRPHLVRALDLVLMRRKLRRDELADAVDQELLFGGEAEVHGVSGWRRSRTLVRGGS